MPHLKLIRFTEVHDATVGRLFVDAGNHPPIWTLEDAWRDNERRKSCIPAGTYKAVPHGWEDLHHVRFPKTWRLVDVPNRDAILVCHAGNDIEDTEGCVLAGLSMTIQRNRAMITESKVAIELLREMIGEQGFTLTVT